MGDFKYNELDIIMDSLRKSINDSVDIFFQLILFAEFLLAEHFKMKPEMFGDNLNPNKEMHVTSLAAKPDEQSLIPFWSTIFSYRNAVVHRGKYASLLEIYCINEYSETLVNIANKNRINLNIGMLNAFVRMQREREAESREE